MDDPPLEPLRHHGDVEAIAGLLDLAVNVYAGPRPAWLDEALHDSIDVSGSYPSATTAETAIALRHGCDADQVLATAGAAEAFSLLARLQRWRRPVVVHPQFTEPHAALLQAGNDVTAAVLGVDFALDPDLVPDDADLVVVGNPTNPTGVLHPAKQIRTLLQPGRMVVVDEAFMDAVPGQTESLAGSPTPGLAVIRSLTKHWTIPGIRAGYVLTTPDVAARLRRGQVPWSVSTTAAAAMVACSTDKALVESARRAHEIADWCRHLEKSLSAQAIPHVTSSAPFVLAQVGEGVHAALRDLGVAVRRADTFPGLGPSWVRIAVRPPEVTARLMDALSRVAVDDLD